MSNANTKKSSNAATPANPPKTTTHQQANTAATSIASAADTFSNNTTAFTAISFAEKQVQRAARFGLSNHSSSTPAIASHDEALKKRAERFGLSLKAGVPQTPATTNPTVISTPVPVSFKMAAKVVAVGAKKVVLGIDANVLKKRAERFGNSDSYPSSSSSSSVLLVVPSATTTTATPSKITVAKRPATVAVTAADLNDFELRKKQRGERFAASATKV
ncbi:hypothetical protein HK100_012842 [Physocladia obscura]|uniref:THO1-MOS11 C-terminal domain-containing protein n=1 Tax=Physocladia obscura TaxID=109957 RepID=A0AAD5XCX1_9FUNG|nr:hypothetical protein HK100_012842 [Physocladia obscura]